MTDFNLPELGENIGGGDVLRVLVKPGDVLAKDQPVIELETDKATIEVPSSVSGTVVDVRVKDGDRVKVGQAILSVDVGGAQGSAPGAAAEAPVRFAPKAAAPEAPAAIEAGRSAKDKEPATGDATAPRAHRGEVVDISRGVRSPTEPAFEPAGPQAPAAPSVRRLARELGVDVSQVVASGPDGRISLEDVKAHAKRLLTSGAPAGAAAAEPLPDFTRWGAITREPMRGVRRKTAEHLSAAWATIPHVTQHDLADITGFDDLRRKYATRAEATGGHLTVTAVALKVVSAALKAFPQFNASIDAAAGEIIYKQYVHIGVAVDTDRGLLVPVVRDVDSKSVVQLAVELAQLAEKARNRKLSLEDMQGGCFTITNLGGLGGTAFTPIVNAPEVAILGIARASLQPVFRDGTFVPRLMLPLALSYDHRVIDGADGVRFLRWVAETLEQPYLLALQE